MRAVPARAVHLVADEEFELPELRGRALPSGSFTETYYDTEDRRLDRAGFTLRRRVENGKGMWQLLVSSDGTLLELEVPGGPAAPPPNLQELVSAASAGFALTPVARLRTRRGGIRVKEGSHSLAKVGVSSIAVLDGRRVVRQLHEIEVEPLAGGRKQLARIEKALRKAGAAPLDDRPRLARALDADEPQEAPAPTQALERLRNFFREQYARMLAHDPGVRVGEDVEDLHRLRVAARRLRSIVRTAGPILDAAWADHLRAELSWLGDALGPARDLDVMLEHLRAEAADLDAADRKALAPVFKKLNAERRAAQAYVLEALRSERYLALLATVEGAAAAPPVGESDGSLESAAKDEFQRLRKAMHKVETEPSDEALHKARIKGKRARYAAELVEDELGKPASKLVSRAKAFQDVAGEHQDAVVAEQRIRALIDGSRSQRAVLAAGILIGRQRERRHNAAAALPTAWARLDESVQRVWG
jgi:CHAD domain-containing protein